MSARRHGAKAWVALFTGIALWDVFALVTKNETLSAAFHRGRTSQRGWLVVLGWTYLTLHLLHAIPKRLDPLRVSAHQVTR